TRAFSATRGTGVPWNPRSANSVSAASRIFSRLSDVPGAANRARAPCSASASMFSGFDIGVVSWGNEYSFRHEMSSRNRGRSESAKDFGALDAIETELARLRLVQIVAVEERDRPFHHRRPDAHRAIGHDPVGAAVLDAERQLLEPRRLDGAT